MEDKKLTAANGRLVADNQNVQTVGPRGPMVLQDPWFIEKLAHFDREVIPERRMHAKGSGAFGTFTVTHDITKYTKAAIFSEEIPGCCYPLSPSCPPLCRISWRIHGYHALRRLLHALRLRWRNGQSSQFSCLPR